MHRPVLLLRTLSGVVLGAALVAPAPAALWLGSNWALLGEIDTLGVYDTNLTARADGEEDLYGSLTPRVTLSRRGSASRFELDAQVERTWFQDFSEYNSTDPQVDLLVEYPERTPDDPSVHLDLHWGRDSTTNTDLGRRVRNESWRGFWEQRVFDTGRTVGSIRVNARSVDYREEDLNTNRAVSADLGVGYGISGAARLGLVYGREWSQSQGALDRGDTDGSEDRASLRLLGALTPKLSGSIEIGMAWVTYTGAVDRDDSDWIGSANLRWEAAPATFATLRAARYTDYSPEGTTALRTESLVELTRELGRGFSVRIGGGIRNSDLFFDDVVRRADAIIATGGLAYQLTDRFSAEIADRWTRQDDDREGFDYSRHVVTGQLSFLF